MPALEQVCKRLFSKRSSLLEYSVSGWLMVVPSAHFLVALTGLARAGSGVTSRALSDFRLIGYLLMSIILFIGLAAVVKFPATFSGR
jgi:hypothetical protein